MQEWAAVLEKNGGNGGNGAVGGNGAIGGDVS